MFPDCIEVMFVWGPYWTIKAPALVTTVGGNLDTFLNSDHPDWESGRAIPIFHARVKQQQRSTRNYKPSFKAPTVFAKEGVSLSDSCSFLSLVWSLTVICHSLLTFILLGMILLGFPPSSNTKCFTSKLTVSGYIFPAVSIFSLKSVWRCLARVNPLQIDQIHYKVLHPLSRKCNKSDNNNLPDTDHQYFMTMKSLSKQLQSINRFSARSHSHWLIYIVWWFDYPWCAMRWMFSSFSWFRIQNLNSFCISGGL